jgi:glycosyltransferase involved in cell wall biosynthesis
MPSFAVPRVTVIIATYNWSSVLPYSIGSVLRQTFTDFELLVVGDGCTDDSEQVVKAIADPRVHWTNLPENTRHQSGPNNEGLRRARGEFIAYLGHDDLWLPHHLEVMVAALDRTQGALAYSLKMNVAADGEFAWPAIPNPAAGAFGSPLSIVHRKRVTDEIGGWKHYRELTTTTPDVELWRRAYAAGYKFTAVPRLTGIKFPAAARRNVYVTRPSRDQARWAARIEAEPDFEFEQMLDFVVRSPGGAGLPYRQLIRNVARETVARLRMRLAFRSWGGRPRRSIDEARRFKGLQGD